MHFEDTRLQEFLDENGVEYETIHHQRDFTAQQTAAHTHTHGREFAKAVVLKVGNSYAMAVLPSHHLVDAERLGAALGGKRVELASEDEIGEICNDCELGAVPPFGNLYGLPVYVSPALGRCEKITCVAGTHADAIRLTYRDFDELVHPRSIDFSFVPHPERVAAGAPARG